MRVAIVAVAAVLLSTATLEAATYTVTTTADSGAGSLRQAILDANANPGTDTINFAIGSGNQTIGPATDLPEVTDPVIIDGTTQPGYAGTPLIGVTSSVSNATFKITAGNSTLRGMRFVDVVVELRTAGSNTIAASLFFASTRCGFFLYNSHDNTLGGTTAADSNSFGGASALCIDSSNNNLVKGNSISGRFYGLSMGGTGNLIGGTEAGAGNTIGGGYVALSLGGTGNSVKGNVIDGAGRRSGGTVNAGITVYGSNNTIGGLEAGAANIISNTSGGSGITFTSATATGNAILSNSIYGNTHKGINLLVQEVNTSLPNDALDADSGANNRQNYPQICSVVQSGQNIVISGRLHSTPNMQFTIQFFSNDPVNGSCQGKTFLGTTTVTTNASGDAPFTATVPGSANTLISSTATDANNNTSELSPCTRCLAPNDFNGDGNSDIFWRNTTTGENTLWLMNSRTIIGGGNIPAAPQEWQPWLGDYNGDGRTDIFWRNVNNGGTGVWFLNGIAISGGGNLPSMTAEWHPLPGDFTGDGKYDLLWRNINTGEQVLWGARSGFPPFEVLGNTPGTTAGVEWQRRAGTLNGDSMFDIFWRNSTNGGNSFWYMDGRTIIGGGNLWPAGSQWTPSFGDSNGDGRSDILWRDSNTGELTFWFMSGGTIIDGGNIPPAGSPWVLHRGDFNGDGRLDIFWRSPVDGENTFWLMNGRTIIGGGNIPHVPGTDWLVIEQPH